MDELRELLEKAVELGKKTAEDNDKLSIKVKELTEKLNTQKDTIKSLMDNTEPNLAEIKEAKEKIEELTQDISDVRKKYKTLNQVLPENVKNVLRDLAVKSFNDFIKNCKSSGSVKFDNYFKSIEDNVKTLNLGSGSGTASAAVAEVLSQDLIEYAREFSPILGEVFLKSGLTRDYRELVLATYPDVSDGIEGVPGTDFAATGTQTYGEVKADVIKVMANAPITDEAFFGTTYNVYADLVRLLGDEINIKLAYKVMYGNGADKNGRGILSSNRVDLTTTTGESWKPVTERDPDYFGAIATGVDGDLGVDNESIINFVEDIIAALPTAYLATATWKMNRKTRARLAKVKNDALEPVFKRNYIEGGVDTIAGFKVKLDDTMPNIASGSTPIIFGDLSKAFAIANGDVNYMQLNPYKTQGVTYVEHNNELFTIMQRSDAVIMVACVTNEEPA